MIFDVEFYEDMYINIWYIKVRSLIFLWGWKRVCKIGYVRGYMWMEGKKGEKIEDNV